MELAIAYFDDYFVVVAVANAADREPIFFQTQKGASRLDDLGLVGQLFTQLVLKFIIAIKGFLRAKGAESVLS